jgi:hypothetical protein
MGQSKTNANLRGGRWWATFLDTVGDMSGSINQAVDGSVTPVNFMFTVPAGYIYYVHRAIITLKDAGTFDVEKYGNGITLANGVILGSIRDGAVVDATFQKPIMSNGDWAAYAYDLTFHTEGTGENVAAISYEFERDGQPVMIHEGGSFLMQIRDDLTGLTEQQARIAGVLVKLDRSVPTLPYLVT